MDVSFRAVQMPLLLVLHFIITLTLFPILFWRALQTGPSDEPSDPFKTVGRKLKSNWPSLQISSATPRTCLSLFKCRIWARRLSWQLLCWEKREPGPRTSWNVMRPITDQLMWLFAFCSTSPTARTVGRWGKMFHVRPISVFIIFILFLFCFYLLVLTWGWFALFNWLVSCSTPAFIHGPQMRSPTEFDYLSFYAEVRSGALGGFECFMERCGTVFLGGVCMFSRCFCFPQSKKQTYIITLIGGSKINPRTQRVLWWTDSWPRLGEWTAF